jgi:hypothetical protein
MPAEIKSAAELRAMENGKKATVAGAVIRGNDRAQQRGCKDVRTAMRYHILNWTSCEMH